MTPWDDVAFQYPNVPTMISAEERRYLYWLGARYWKGTGHIIEIGPWLGGSTVCLAAGMRDNPRAGAYRLHVFDNFRWRAFMADRAPLPLAVGDSFQGFFEKNIARYSDLVAVHRQALPDGPVALDRRAQEIQPGKGEDDPIFAWQAGQPVEILFIDGAKSWSGLCHLLATLADDLAPGRTLFVCQDYKYWGTYWVPLIMERLADRFALEHNLANNTVSFRMTAPLARRDIAAIGSVETTDRAQGERLLDAASDRLRDMGDAPGARIVRASKIRFLLQKGETARAERLFRDMESRWPYRIGGHTVDWVREWLERETGKRYAPTPRWRGLKLLWKLRSKAGRLAAAWR